MNDAESRREQIWDKWIGYPVPVSIQEQCAQECEPIREMLEDLTRMNLETGNMPHEEAGRLGTYAGEATSHFARATFNFGLEYGSKETRQITLDVVREKAKEALPLIRAESEQLTKLVTQLVSGAAASGALDPDKLNSLAYQLGKIELRSAAMCFQIGMEYSGRQRDAQKAPPVNVGAADRLGGPMSSSQTPMTADDVFAAVQLMWTSDEHQSMQPTDMLVSMLYETFGEPSPGLDAKGRGLLRSINNLDAELIRLEHRFMALNSSFSAIMYALSVAAADADKVAATKRFVVSLEDFLDGFHKSVQDSHTMTMDLRADLLKDTYSNPS